MSSIFKNRQCTILNSPGDISYGVLIQSQERSNPLVRPLRISVCRPSFQPCLVLHNSDYGTQRYSAQTERPLKGSVTITRTISTARVRKPKGVYIGNANIERIFSFLPNAELFGLFLKIFHNKICHLRTILAPILEKRVIFTNENSPSDNLRLFSSVLSIFRFQLYPTLKQNYGQQTIKLDSERTFLTSDSQSKLACLLERLCRCSGVQYIQGMNYIAAHALKNSKSIEDAFRLCFFVMNQMKYRQLVANEFRQLKHFNEKIQKKVKKELPVLWTKLTECGLDTSILTTRWLITLFCQTLSRETTNKIWLLFFLFGWPLLIDAAFHLLEFFASKFLCCEQTCWPEFMIEHRDLIDRADQTRLLGQLRRKWVIHPKSKKTGIRLTSLISLRA